jgi:hypothetical protein
MITTRSDNTLKTAVTPRSLMDMNTKGMELSSRLDGVAFAIVSILMHESDDWTAMSLNVASSGNKRKVEYSAIATNTANVGLVKSEVDIMRTSEPVIPPLVPPSIKELISRVDGVAFAIVSILMHESNDWTAMSLNVACSSNERKVEHSAIADTADVGLVKVRGGYNVDIGTRHPTICATVHQGAQRRSQVMVGQVVLDSHHVDMAVVTTINLDKTGRCRRSSWRDSRGSICRENLLDKTASSQGGAEGGVAVGAMEGGGKAEMTLGVAPAVIMV